MNILLECSELYVTSILENKLNENDEFLIFNVLKELGNFDDYGKNKPLPLFQSFVAKFEEAAENAQQSSKSLVVEGLGHFFRESKLSILEKSYLEWYLEQFGCIVIDVSNSDTVSFITNRFARIPYNPNSDFYADLRQKLDEKNSLVEKDYIVQTFRALDTTGNFIGNFSAKEFIPLKKVNLENIITKVFASGDIEDTIDRFRRGEISFYKESHPFQLFLELHAKNQHS